MSGSLSVLSKAPNSGRWVNGGSDVPDELICAEYVNVMNKIAINIAFERVLCYNCAEMEKNHAA